MGRLSSEKLIKSLLTELGEDVNREGLKRTPHRVVKSWNELYSGYKIKPEKVLGTTFSSEGYDQMVLLRDIELFSTCEHHMLPFFGRAHVAYIPSKRVVGLSKLARLVECYSRRLQIQERLTQQIAKSIQDVLNPVGVAVVIEAEHFCMRARGVNKQNSIMVTSCLLGAFKDDVSARAEFMQSIGWS